MMKTRFYFILIFAIGISILILINRCTKYDPCEGHPSQTYNYYVSDSNKSKIPYTGTDTLVFVSDSGDITTLYGTGKQTLIKTFSEQSTLNPDCGNVSYWNFERIVMTFTGTSIKLNKFVYSLSYDYVSGSPPTPVRQSNGLGFEFSSGIGVFISCGTFTIYANNIADYTDSVTINGYVYKGINLCDSSNVLYNYNYGILRFIDANKEIWTKKF